MVAPIPAKRGRKPAVATAPATGQVQSLTRGLKLLEWIAESNGSVALTELAQQAGLPNSTTHRLLTTMQQQGFVRQVGELGHWAIGAHAFMVGSSFLQSRNLLAIVHPILRNLMEESGETVNMAVPRFAGKFVFRVARQRDVAEIHFRHVANFVVIIKHHAPVTGDAKVFK